MEDPVIVASMRDQMWQCAVESAMDGSPSQPSRGTNCGNNGAINGPAGPPKVPQVVRETAFGSHNWSRGSIMGALVIA